MEPGVQSHAATVRSEGDRLRRRSTRKRRQSERRSDFSLRLLIAAMQGVADVLPLQAQVSSLGLGLGQSWPTSKIEDQEPGQEGSCIRER